MKNIRILLTGSGAPGWVPIYKCLLAGNKQLEIYGCDINSQTAGSFYAKKHFTVPSGTDPTYIAALIKLAIKEKIDVILPITDAELLPLSENISKFKQHNILIPVSSPESLETSLNKLKLFDFLRKEKLNSCDFYVAHSWEEFKKYIKILGFPKKPICFKPTKAWGSRGFRILDPQKNMFDLLMNEKPTSTYTTFENIEQILQSAKHFSELLVMEYLPGREYTVDIFMEKGKALYVIPRLRVGMKGGITTEGIVEENKEIITLSKKIAEKLTLSYCVGIQFRYDSSNQPKVLEINPRLQGTTVISYGAGVNLPYYTLLSLFHEKIPTKKIMFGIHMLRHWNEIFFDGNKKLSIVK